MVALCSPEQVRRIFYIFNLKLLRTKGGIYFSTLQGIRLATDIAEESAESCPALCACVGFPGCSGLESHFSLSLGPFCASG